MPRTRPPAAKFRRQSATAALRWTAMNFDFSEDAKAVREHASRFLRERVPSGAVRKHIESGAAYDKALWSEIAEMGWLGATIPEAFGGSAMGYETACVLAEEIGAVVAPVPFGPSLYLASEALLAFGSDAQKRTWLPLLASGEKIGCFAIADGEGDPAPENVRAHVVGGKLTCEKFPVPNAEGTDVAIVVARREAGGVGLFIAPLDGHGVERVTLRGLDVANPQVALRLVDTPVEPLAGGQDWAAVTKLLDRAAILFAFEQIGGARAALDMAVTYAKSRYAFGRPIGSFQAVKHKLADMYVAIEIARSNAYFGAWALERDAAELPLAAATARTAASEAYQFAAKENIQVHGGMGFTWESDCHLYYTRAKALALAIGSVRHWKRALMPRLDQRTEAADGF
jgi:alkylation response protein AidB-like acyl-CoA dehydrogenase